MLVCNLFLVALALSLGITAALSDGVFRELATYELPICSGDYEARFYNVDIVVDTMISKCNNKDMVNLGKWIQQIVNTVGDSMPEYKGDVTKTNVCATPKLTGGRRLTVEAMHRRLAIYTYTAGGRCSRCTSGNYRFLSAAYTDGNEKTREDMDKVGNMQTLDSGPDRSLLGHLSRYLQGKSPNKPDSGSTYSQESLTKERKLPELSPICAEAAKARLQNELAQAAFTTANSMLVEVTEAAAGYNGNQQVSSIITEVKVAHETVRKQSEVAATAAALALQHCQKEVTTSTRLKSLNLEATKRLTVDATTASTRAQEALLVIKNATGRLADVIFLAEATPTIIAVDPPLQYIVSTNNSIGESNWAPEDEVKGSMELWLRKFGNKLIQQMGPFLMKTYSTSAGGCLNTMPQITVTITEVKDPSELTTCI